MQTAVTRWFVFGRATPWGLARADLAARSMCGYGRQFGSLESPPTWMYW